MYMKCAPAARARPSVGRVLPGGAYGTLSAATAGKRSGRSRAAFHATGAPQSCPTIAACSTPEGVEEADHVPHVMELVLLHRVGPVRAAVPAHVGRHRMVAGGGQRGELMPPGVPGLRESVAEDDRGAREPCSAIRIRMPLVSTSRWDRGVARACSFCSSPAPGARRAS